MGGKSGGSSASPDPQIGAAALENIQLGRDWLSFAKDQFGESNIRQDDLDALTKRSTTQQLDTQTQANQWATEDRASGLYDRAFGLSQRDSQTAQSEADRAWGLTQRDSLTNQAAGLTDRANEISGWADQDRAFATGLRDEYNSTFKPVNAKVASDAMGWDSEERQAQQAAVARADVLTNAAIAQGQSNRQMAAMGVNPNSGRFEATDRLAGLETALGSAQAQNASRTQVQREGVDMRLAAANLGQNILGQSTNVASLANNTQSLSNSTNQLSMAANGQALSSASYATQTGANPGGMAAAGFAAGQYNAGLGAAGLGVSAGSAGLSGALSNQASYLNQNQIMNQGFQGAMQGNSSGAGILNQQYSTNVSAANAANASSAQQSAGMMSGIGSAVGVAAVAF